jgi:hypothetical protein
VPDAAPTGLNVDPMTFDHLVVGSSPLMLLHALALAEAGGSVMLVDRDDRPGGAWQAAVLKGTDGRPLHVERACHVIEVFPGVYEWLATASGTAFADLDVQPIRVHHPSGLIVPYFNRFLMLLSGLRLAVGYTRSFVHTRILGRGDEDRLLNFQSKVRSYLRYQSIEFIRSSRMKGPRHGFVDFIDRLHRRCADAGVRFEQFDVAELERIAGRWVARGADGSKLAANQVHVTTSANLRRISEKRFEADAPLLVERAAVIVAIAPADLRVRQTYVAFWSDPLVSRISRLDSPEGGAGETRFLIESRSPGILQRSDLDSILRDKLEVAHILKPGGRYTLLGKVDYSFARYVDQLPEGEIAENLFGYFSSGNLAAGVAGWLDRGRKQRA